jgi:hypothetical protein
MTIHLYPLLQIQRDLYRLPRGMERFNTYLATLMQGQKMPELVPLIAMNPMAREHVAERLDELLAIDAEAVAAAAVDEGNRRLPPPPDPAPRLGLVVIDDAKGGWTGRGFLEMDLRFALYSPKYNWITVMLWSSESWPAAKIRADVLAMLYRTAHMQRHGVAQTLDQLLAQEGRAARFADWPPAALDADDLEYTREVIASYRATSVYATMFTCLFGDDAARAAGYPPLGLSAYAGLALAYAEACERAESPEAALGSAGDSA